METDLIIGSRWSEIHPTCRRVSLAFTSHPTACRHRIRCYRAWMEAPTPCVGDDDDQAFEEEAERFEQREKAEIRPLKG